MMFTITWLRRRRNAHGQPLLQDFLVFKDVISPIHIAMFHMELAGTQVKHRLFGGFSRRLKLAAVLLEQLH